jgi:hypothetical protein
VVSLTPPGDKLRNPTYERNATHDKSEVAHHRVSQVNNEAGGFHALLMSRLADFAPLPASWRGTASCKPPSCP